MNRILLFLISVFTFSLSSCHCQKKSTKAPEPAAVSTKAATKDFEKENYLSAKIIDYSAISGCSFIIQTDDGKKFQPKNLPDEFKKVKYEDGIDVWVKFIIEDVPNICMTGKVVRILDIQKRQSDFFSK